MNDNANLVKQMPFEALQLRTDPFYWKNREMWVRKGRFAGGIEIHR
jgi:hypothetical protein